MPDMANITVKKADGTTDIVYAKVVASSGNNSPAVWRSPVGAAPAHKAELKVKTSANQTNSVRRANFEFTYPQTATGTDGSVSIVQRFNLSLNASIPQGMTQTEINEAVSQGLNLAASTLLKDSLKEGFAPT